ncbi:MAG: hypothetical protein V3U24_07535 [Candidatus Neomarinimicrobiota bacterium]
MVREEFHISQSVWIALFLLVPVFSGGTVGESHAGVYDPQKDRKSWFSFLSPGQHFASIKRGDSRLFEAVFRPLEFKQPIVTMPVEGRYGIGFYGRKGFNPVEFNSSLITYEPGTAEIIEKIDLSGRMGSFLEVDAFQTNLSHLLLKKSYLDVLTGLGFRYSSIYGIPDIELLAISGPPEVPSSWDQEKKFSPTVMEGNLVTSLIMQWKPKWFLHLKYSYGLNRTRFYRDDNIDRKPFGTGRSATVSLGLKYVLESETEARYAWGLELRHIYHKVTTVPDPEYETKISGFHLPTIGLYFTFGAFYGGRTTVGDEGKKDFLKGDYVSARRKLLSFVNKYPDHTRIKRARSLVQLCERRIPEQLYAEGIQLAGKEKMDRALEKFVKASLTSDAALKRKIRVEIEGVADYYLEAANTLFDSRKDEDALRLARRAASVSDRSRESLRLLEGRILFRQGKDLALRGFYPMALRKFSRGFELAPSLREDIREAELEVAAKMLEDVNKASDEGSLRLALQSLYTVREILGTSDPSMDRIIERLEGQLSHLDEILLRYTLQEQMDEAREERARGHAPRVQRGMLVAEVQAILGDPYEVVERVDDRQHNHQMWIYHVPEEKKRFYYFEDYVLYRIEEE